MHIDRFYIIFVGDTIPSVDGSDEGVTLNHFDRLAFGRFHLFRYEAGGIIGKKNGKNNTQKNGNSVHNGSLRHSVSWEDTTQKMGTEKDDVNNDGIGLNSVKNGNEKRNFENAPGWDFAQQELMAKNDAHAHSQTIKRNSINGNNTSLINLSKNNSPISPSTSSKNGQNWSNFSPKMNNGVTREFLTRNSTKLNSVILNSVNINSLSGDQNLEEKKNIFLSKSSSENQDSKTCDNALLNEKEVEEGRDKEVVNGTNNEKEKHDDVNDDNTIKKLDTKIHREDLKLNLMSMENMRKNKIGNNLPRTIISQNTNNLSNPEENIRNTKINQNPSNSSNSNFQPSALLDTTSFSTSSATSSSSSSSRVMLSRQRHTEVQNPLNFNSENGENMKNVVSASDSDIREKEIYNSNELSSSSSTEKGNIIIKTDAETKKSVKNVIENSLNDFSTLRQDDRGRKERNVGERTDKERMRTDLNGQHSLDDRDSKYISNGRNEIIQIDENQNSKNSDNSEIDDRNNLEKKSSRRIIISSARHLNQNFNKDFKSEFQQNGALWSKRDSQENDKLENKILNSRSNDSYNIEKTEINNSNNQNNSSISSPSATFEKEALALQLELTQMQKALQERMFRYQVLTSFNPDKKIEKT